MCSVLCVLQYELCSVPCVSVQTVFYILCYSTNCVLFPLFQYRLCSIFCVMLQTVFCFLCYSTNCVLISETCSADCALFLFQLQSRIDRSILCVTVHTFLFLCQLQPSVDCVESFVGLCSVDVTAPLSPPGSRAVSTPAHPAGGAAGQHQRRAGD